MCNKKVNLTFDADVIANGANKNSTRSGIYFTSINILKNLIKNNDIELRLYCPYKKLAKLYLVLDYEFEKPKFNIISEVPNNIFTKIHSVFLKNRTIAKNNKQKAKKFLFDIFTRFLAPIQKIQSVLNYNNFIKEINKANAYFSCVLAFPDFVKDNNKIEKYLVLYDCVPLVIPSCHPASKKGSWFDKLINSLTNKDNYFAISNSTRNDYLHFCPQINPKRIITTLLACDDKFKPKNKEEIKKVKVKYNIPQDKKYIFSLCTLEPRKNLIRTVKTYVEFIKKHNINDLVFVLGGGNWQQFIQELDKEINGLGDFRENILKIGYVEDKDLAPLYSGAEWFVYTSRYEGFGLPPLEAMSCACPVIASNNSSLPEVVGDAGIMIDWDDDEAHISAYEKYYYDEKFKKEMTIKGLERSKYFSWEKCVNKIAKTIIENNK